MTKTFETKAHAKCILAGEHAVIRGYPAIILPIHNRFLTLAYTEGSQPLSIAANTKYEELFLTFFWGGLRSALSLLHKDLSSFQGNFVLKNNIEMGAGIGFSAALCVVITRWLAWKQLIPEDEIFHFAHELENVFHGQSSGVDIAGSMADTPVHFKKGRFHNVDLHWLPHLYISHCGVAKITEEAVNRVRNINQRDPEKGKKIDREMGNSVALIEQSLSEQKEIGYPHLISGIEEAQRCFKDWNLIGPKLQAHIDKLYELGADAVKPTGAGGGGFVLSLWHKKPSKVKSINLTPILLTA